MVEGICMRCTEGDLLLFLIDLDEDRRVYVCNNCYDEIMAIRRLSVKFRLKAGIIKKIKQGTCELCDKTCMTMFPILTRSEATGIIRTIYICPSCCEEKKLIDTILNEFKIEDKIRITMWDD